MAFIINAGAIPGLNGSSWIMDDDSPNVQVTYIPKYYNMKLFKNSL